MKFLSEPIVSQNYWHSGKPQADAASQIIKCVKMHLLQKKKGGQKPAIKTNENKSLDARGG